MKSLGIKEDPLVHLFRLGLTISSSTLAGKSLIRESTTLAWLRRIPRKPYLTSFLDL